MSKIKEIGTGEGYREAVAICRNWGNYQAQESKALEAYSSSMRELEKVGVVNSELSDVEIQIIRKPANLSDL